MHSKVLHSLRGRIGSGSPQPYFVEILRRGGSPAAGGKRKPHLRVWRRWGRVWLDHQGVERSVSLVCGIPCVWEKSDHGRIVALLSGILRVWEELMSKKMLFSISKRYPPARGEDPSRNVIRFPVTKVPVSTIVALHSKVLRNLPGRIGSGSPQPYFVEILRRGGNTAVRGAVGTTLLFLRTT